MMEALRSSETSVFTRATRRNIPEDGILRSHKSENVNLTFAHKLLTCLDTVRVIWEVDTNYTEVEFHFRM
jgi:hypothetical protein